MTGLDGRYVKSHIIPQALTERVWQGEPLTQRSRSGRLINRWTSWYDARLVTQAGEKILASYDDFAVKLFRQHRMVWSSWGNNFQLSAADHETHPELNFGFRHIKGVDTVGLRLFLLSLLWRAAATTLFEFENVRIGHEELEKLRGMVQSGTAEPHNFFPATLIQLSTRNFPHNRSAYFDTKTEPTGEIDGFEKQREVPHFRFYFDGLIVHFHLYEDPENFCDRATVFVGPSPHLRFITIPSDTSSQMGWFWHHVEQAEGERSER